MATKALAWLTVATLLVIPLAVTPGRYDVYRVFKELLLRAEGILAGVLLVAALLFCWSRQGVRALRDSVTVRIAAAAVAWTVVTTLTSTNRLLSVETAVSIACAALVAIGAWFAAPRNGLIAIDMVAVAVVVNTAIAALQAYGIWQPIEMRKEIQGHLKTTAFIGNPNEVGSYLALAGVILLAAAMKAPPIRRRLYGATFIVSIAGVLISQTRTAMIALAFGVLFLAGRRSLRAAFMVVVIGAIAIASAAALRLPGVIRLLAVPRLALEGEWQEASSQRIPAFLAAVEMFRDRPLLGLGPGTYGVHYLPYKLRVIDEYPAELSTGAAVNFGETHNDHLQILAESGVLGYAIFIAALVALARLARRRSVSDDPRAAIAHIFAVPFAVTIAILMLAQFPLQVASMQHLILTMAALGDRWSEL